MELHEMRKVFIESAVKVVARDGLEKTTTKSISAVSGLNEAYIYRCFAGKDDLLRTAFLMEDNNFAEMLIKQYAIMKTDILPVKERAFLLWKRSWDFILEFDDDCIFYLRYYHSAHFRQMSYNAHMESYRALTEKAAYIFKEGTPVILLLHQIFDTMLSFASRVVTKELENSDELVQWIFEQIYLFTAPHVRAELFESNESKTEEAGIPD